MKKVRMALLAMMISAFTIVPALADDDYLSRFREAFNAQLDSLPGVGSDICVAIKIGPDGSYKVLGVGNADKNQPDAVRQVYGMLNKVTSLPPLPSEYAGKPYSWMYFSWKHSDTNHRSRGFGGPNFATEIPKFAQYSCGLMKRSYTDSMKNKLIHQFTIETGKGAAVVHLTLGSAGEIKSIKISAEDKTQEKLVYDTVAKAHPFGALPSEFAATPNFLINMKWSMTKGNGMRDIEVQHVAKF